MKKLFPLLAALTLLTAVGCSKDDNQIDPNLLTGKWSLMAEYDGRDDRWTDHTGDGHYLLLNADGTGAKGSRSSKDSFQYSCQGNTLRIDYGGKDVSEVTIETLSETELILASDGESDSGETYTDKERYERAK